jgi:hypothetical protein
MKLRITDLLESAPHYLDIVPASQCIPEWYKNMPLKVQDNNFELINETDGSVSRNITIKGLCTFS